MVNLNFLKEKEVKIFFTVWFVYLVFLSGYGGNWMANSMLGLTMSVVDNHSLSIDQYVKGNEDNAFFQGHYYSGFAPGSSFLAVPFYFIFKPLINLIPEFLAVDSNQFRLILLNILASVLIASFFSALISVLVYKVSADFSKNKKLRILLSFITSFGTLLFLYSTTFDGKIISAFFSFLAFYILFRVKRSKNCKLSYLFYAGLLLGFSVATEYSQFIALVLLSLYLLTFLRDRKVFVFFAGILIPLVFLLVYHQVVFNNPLTTPYAHRASDYINSEYYKGFEVSLSNFYELLFSSFRGFFFYMPILILSFYGIYLGMKKFKSEMFLILFIFLGFLAYNALFASDLFRSAGCSFGPRHLIPVIPFLVLPLAFITSRFWKFLVYLAASLSVIINLLPNLYGVTHLWTYKCMESNPLKYYIPFVFERGLTNYTLNLIKYEVVTFPLYIINLIALSLIFLLILVLYPMWKKRD